MKYISLIQSVLMDRGNFISISNTIPNDSISFGNFALISITSLSYTISIFYGNYSISTDSIILLFFLFLFTISIFYIVSLFLCLLIDYKLSFNTYSINRPQLLNYSRICLFVFLLALPLNILFINGLKMSMASFLSGGVCLILYIYYFSGGIKEIYSIDAGISRRLVYRSIFLFFTLPIILLTYFLIHIISILGV